MVTSDELLIILLQYAIIALGGCDKTGKMVVNVVHRSRVLRKFR